MQSDFKQLLNGGFFLGLVADDAESHDREHVEEYPEYRPKRLVHALVHRALVKPRHDVSQ